jgi:hypothetical protein
VGELLEAKTRPDLAAISSKTIGPATGAARESETTAAIPTRLAMAGRRRTLLFSGSVLISISLAGIPWR